jgi:hypothetical protein
VDLSETLREEEIVWQAFRAEKYDTVLVKFSKMGV